MKNLFLSIALVVSSLRVATANTPVLVTGYVMDAQTHEPLPFANVIYAHIGTTTNFDGEFVLLIDNPDQEHELLVKFIGYESQSIPLSKNMNDIHIQMKQSTEFLDDIEVYSAELIMKDVNNFHQINYEYGDQLMKTYYKESVNTPNECAYLAEGIFDIYLPTIYSKEKSIVEAKKTRRKEFLSLDSLGIPMFNGHASDMIQSATRREDSFLNKDNMNNYVYSKESITNYDGKEVFILKFEPRNKKGNTRGTLYVDSETKAVIKAEYFPVIDNQIFWTNVKWTEEYVHIDGTWYIHTVSYSGTWDHYGQTYSYKALLVVTDFDTVSEAPQMTNALHDDAIFFHEATGFSENFWDDHNYVKLTLKEKNALVME
ncbi:carboxypeptidase-like regulatory domain-containing protein [Reichenbachiella versicolor]|uniref:carboxypeptidase-like regulatory domain-containing protein n=1 Tax=Reichenbachiella versicolor TaxID=1821036 RepID=UPI000D6E6D6F|nr:carboxypeptidase-like regulatory domain-containing protein [Reichenbachiella versicolor]